MTAAYRLGRPKTRKQNTYQICPASFFTFAGQIAQIRELVQSRVQSFVEEAKLDETGKLETSFTDFLNSLKDSLLIKQQRFFPRHKLVVHGLCGTLGENQPSLCFGTHTFMSLDCGDDVVGASCSNSICYAAVCVAGFAQD